MSEVVEADVFVVGGGPVGLTLAMCLALRGVSVAVAETRRFAEPPESVKCNHISARSMEIFRPLGLVPKLRGTGLPGDFPNDVSYQTSMLGYELGRTRIPCRARRYDATGGPDTWWPTPEPPHRINQIYMEPVITEHAAAMPRLRLRNEVEVESFAQSENGVVARARSLATGDALEVRSRYLVGCDGGRSRIRKAIGAKMTGIPVIRSFQSTYIRAPQLLSMLPNERAWMTMCFNPRASGITVAIDGRERWLVHHQLDEPDSPFDSVDRDATIREVLGVGKDFEYEILSIQDWVGRRLIADRFRDRRVFLCGDAAHVWIPWAGYGMNAGIADAENLAWLLAAHLNGWAPAAILDAYERERLPITEQVSRYAMSHAAGVTAQRNAVPPAIEDPGPAGAAVREEFGRRVAEFNQQQFCCGGLNFGYFYDDSPLIAYDGETAPPYTMEQFTPSTVPGCRTPHVWLRDGRSLYDAMGPEYTLLRFDRGVDVSAIVEAAASRGVPLDVLDVETEDPVYDRKLVLSRPDRHVAWRGASVPDEPWRVIDLVRGAASRAQ